MGRGNKAVALKKEELYESILPSEETEALLCDPSLEKINFPVRAIQQGLSCLLCKFKEQSNKTNKELGLMMGIGEPAVSKMLRTVDQFTIDFYIEKLSRLNDDSLNKRIQLIVDITKL
jgi:hypothetical protein